MATYPSKTDPTAPLPMMTTRASSKGQIVIPAKLRRKYHIKVGTTIRVIDEGDRIVLRPVTQEYLKNLLNSLRGKYKGKGLLEALKKDREFERNL